MPVKPLPPHPSLEHLKHQAKDLLQAHTARDLGAAQRLREFHPRLRSATDTEIFTTSLHLHDAQLAIAREYGFSSWPRLKAHIEEPKLIDRLSRPHHERIDDPEFRCAVDLLDAGDVSGLRQHLQQHPDLVHQHVTFEGANYFHNPTLLEFIAENPVRHGTLPPNILAVAKIILEAGPSIAARNEALMLVATGRVPRECGVQIALIDLLCDAGAAPNTAAHQAAIHNEPASLHALIRRGAAIDLPIAAAIGRVDAFASLLPAASSQERHLAFALASQYGHVEVVRLLLDAGESLDRYNPVGGHAHSTPLHQAAARGLLQLAQLLVERGARLDMRDILWNATPADWARHEGHPELEAYLRVQPSRPQKDAAATARKLQ
jgi:Ankyrin repeats (3 copies)